MTNYPTPEDRAERVRQLNRRLRVDLWSAVWEASQLMSYDEIRETVEQTLGEIAEDAA